MFLEIVTPEAILFSSEVEGISVPGINGEFQMLNNHAPIVSVLKAGEVKIQASNYSIKEKFQNKFSKTVDGKLSLTINSGTLELNDNKAIILAD
jgi:F-type H+-transporting ATPase subunit epsilon